MKSRPKIRLALYSPDPDDRKRCFISPPLEDTPENRELARKAIRKFNKLSAKDRTAVHNLGLFAVSGRGVRHGSSR